MQRFQDGLRTYRDELKGFAILLVVFYHARLGLSGLLAQWQQICYGGVDVFLLLSGFGLYHSLERDADLHGYMKRRMARVLPTYLPFCVIWLCIMLPLLSFGKGEAVRVAAGNLFMLGFFGNTPLMINWYVSMLAASMLLAPFFHICLKSARHPWRTALALMAASFIYGLCFIGDERYMAVSRLPVFILGMALAMPLSEGKEPKKHIGVYAFASFVIGLFVLEVCQKRFPELLIDYAMYWHPFVLIAPALCMGLCWVLRKAGRFSGAFAPLRFLGRSSFEIYLFNAWVEVLGKRLNLFETPAAWALWSLAGIIAGCAYHMAVNRMMKRWRMQKKL